MYFIIRAIDKADNLKMRMDNRPAHLDYVRNSGCVMLAGPFLTEGIAPTPRGSMLIIEVADRAAAEEFAANDPYAKAGLFTQVQIEDWTPAIGPWFLEEGQ